MLTRTTKIAAVSLSFVLLISSTLAIGVVGGASLQAAGNVGNTPTEGASYTVSNLSAPASVEQGDNVTVNATITNPNGVADTQEVVFRFDGDVVARDPLSLGPENATTVSYTLNTSGVEEGTYFHGVYTRTDGAPAQITVADDIQSFGVSDLSGPDSVDVGSEFTVTATISNPNAFATVQPVEFRFGGTLVEERSVALDAGGETTVEFQARASGTGPGTIIYSVFSRDAGESTLITVETPGQGPPTEGPPETEEPTETAEPPETEEPTETAEPPETEEPTETAEPTETPEPPTTEEPTETEQPTETATAAPETETAV